MRHLDHSRRFIDTPGDNTVQTYLQKTKKQIETRLIYSFEINQWKQVAYMFAFSFII